MILRDWCLSRNRDRARGSVTGAPRAAPLLRRAARGAGSGPSGGAGSGPSGGAGSGPSGSGAEAARDQGSSAIELAILAPVLLLIIWLSIQFAFWYQGRQVALAAAQAGARVARQEASITPAWRPDARSAARNYYSALGTKVLGGNITATPIGSAADQVGVTVSGQVVSIVFGLKLMIHETVTGPVECFRPDLNGGRRCG